MFTFVLLFLASCADHDVIWTADTGNVTQSRTQPSVLAVHRGVADPGGTPLFGSTEQRIQLLDSTNGRVLHQVGSRKTPSFRVDRAYAWDDKLVLFDTGGKSRACSIRIGRDPLKGDAETSVRELGLSASSADGVRRSFGQWLGWIGSSCVMSISAADSTVVYAVQMPEAVVTEHVLDGKCAELTRAGQFIVYRLGNSLICRSLAGAERWRRDDLAEGERLSTSASDDTSDRLFATLRGGKPLARRHGTAAELIVRSTENGAVLWKRELGGVVDISALACFDELTVLAVDKNPDFVYHKGSARDQWFVFDAKGGVVAEGATTFGSRTNDDNPMLYMLGRAWNQSTGELVFGTAVNAVYIEKNANKQKLTELPGQPVFVANGILVCDDGKKLIAVSLRKRP